MAVTSLIKLRQGALVGPPGEALAGVAGVPVFVENDDPTDIQSWRIDVVYAPPGSTVVPGTIGTADGNTPVASFTPDAVPGCYRVIQYTYPQTGLAGTPDVDIRNFAVPDPNGFIFPSYQQLPPKLPVIGSGLIGEKPDEMNFGGQPFGWDGEGTEGLVLDFMRQVSANLGGAINFSYFDIPASGITIPAGQEMIITEMLTGPGSLIVDGKLTQLPPTPSAVPVQLNPAQLTSNVADYNPAGFSEADIVVLTSDAPRTVRGVNPIVVRKQKRFVNGNPLGTDPITLAHEDVLSSPSSRFLLQGASDIVLAPGGQAEGFVDPSAGKWRAA